MTKRNRNTDTRRIAGRPASPLGACLLIVMIVAVWSCEDSVTGSGPFPEIVLPDSNVSYNNSIQPLFNKACTFAGGCHAGDAPAANLSLESYQRLTERLGIVVPGSPEESILQWRIEGSHGLARMPLNRPPLTSNQITGIATWIREGAINN